MRRRGCTGDHHPGDPMRDDLGHGNAELDGLRGERP
jgi:hypothetical protein